MSNYQPPYTITSKILKTVTDIVELISEFDYLQRELITPKLRKKNRIKSITGTLQIEGNSFSEDKVTNVINGKRVLGTLREIEEVKGAIRAYDYLEKYDYKSEKDLLLAHKLLMQNILENAGSYRSYNVVVGGEDRITHLAPPPNRVPYLMGELFDWLKDTDEHLLIVSCLFHYEFVFIHPFSDGNGRVGRLWQSVILNQYKNIFSAIPIESVIRDNQEGYYKALEEAGSLGESTPFIEFMLEIILDTIKSSVKSSYKSSVNTEDKILKRLRENPKTTIKELAEILNITTRAVEKQLAKLKKEKRLIRVGSRRNGYWEVIDKIEKNT